MVEIVMAALTVFAVVVLFQVGPWYLAMFGALIVIIGVAKGFAADDDDSHQN